MEIKVRFFTNLREIVDKREETLIFADDKKITVDLVLTTLSKKYGAPFVEYVYNGKTGQPKNFLQFLVNGTSASTLNGLDTELKDGTVLAILPPSRRRINEFQIIQQLPKSAISCGCCTAELWDKSSIHPCSLMAH